jgi:hypothetical protein
VEEDLINEVIPGRLSIDTQSISCFLHAQKEIKKKISYFLQLFSEERNNETFSESTFHIIQNIFQSNLSIDFNSSQNPFQLQISFTGRNSKSISFDSFSLNENTTNNSQEKLKVENDFLEH